MSALNGPLKPKRSTVSGETPNASDLEIGELGCNTADGKLFIKHSDNTVKEISGGGGGGGGAVNSVNGLTGTVSIGVQQLADFELGTDLNGNPVALSDNQTITYEALSGKFKPQTLNGAALTNDYEDLDNLPVVVEEAPNNAAMYARQAENWVSLINVSQLVNDANYITSAEAPVQTSDLPTEIDDLIGGSPAEGSMLQYGSSSWEVVDYANPPAGNLSWRSGDLTAYPMEGGATPYADAAAMTADGWTEITGYASIDDAAPTFTPPQSFRDAVQGTAFLDGQFPTYNNATWFVNTNGAVGWDNGGGTITARTGNAQTDSNIIDCYVCHKSADLRGRLAGFKTTSSGGVEFLHVRQSYFDPYSQTTNYWVVETVFSSDGFITVKYGTPTTTGLLPVYSASSTNFGIASNGSFFTLDSVSTGGLLGLTATGEHAIELYAGSSEKLCPIKVEHLNDTAFDTPEAGDILIYDAVDGKWKMEKGLSLASLKTEVAAATDFADFQSRIAAL